MKYKAYAGLLALIAPFAIIAVVYVFGWLLTLILMAFGVSLSAARISGVALSILISFMYISYLGQRK